MSSALKNTLVLLTVCGIASVAAAQGTITARISGGGGSGKCTFEIRTGGVANVLIRGNQGRLEAVSGGPAQWVRLVCNQTLPRNPNNFRFKGIDGRGKQELIQYPSNNNGTAVIRITDNRGSMHGYTGDIMWNGGSGNSNGGGWDNGNGGQWPPPGQGGGGQWPPNNQWSNRIIPNCQNAIRNQLVPQFGGTLSFKGTPSQNQAGSFVMVQGRANYRDGSGRSGDIQYNCTMHPNGNVAEAKYNVLNGNFPQPR